MRTAWNCSTLSGSPTDQSAVPDRETQNPSARWQPTTRLHTLIVGLRQSSRVTQHVGEVVPAGQGVGVVGAQHAGAGLQHGAVLGLGFLLAAQVAPGGGVVVLAC